MSVLEINDFSLYVNKNELVKNLSFSLNENEIAGIFCPSGKGKTSLLNYIANIFHETPDYYCKGSKNFYGNNISYVFQEARFLPELSIKKNLMLCSKKNNLSAVENILNSVNLSEKINSFPSELSGGQLQRASIARALLVPFDLLLLDEPFAFQDNENKDALISLIKKYVIDNKKAAIVISHNHEDLDRLCSKIIDFK